MGAPVKNTCPDIDNAIKKIKRALKIASEGRQNYEKGTDWQSDFDAIEDELMCLEGELEDLRSDNSALRDWGHELDEEVEKSATYINELEEKIAKLESNLVNS